MTGVEARRKKGGLGAARNELNQYYGLLLGVESPWEVRGGVKCQECGKECTVADHAPERTWRHLDTMQFETLIRARVPRSDCRRMG